MATKADRKKNPEPTVDGWAESVPKQKKAPPASNSMRTSIQFDSKMVSSDPNEFWSSSSKLSATHVTRNARARGAAKQETGDDAGPQQMQQVFDFESGELRGFYRPETTPPPPGIALYAPQSERCKNILNPEDSATKSLATRTLGMVIFGKCGELVNQAWNEDNGFAELFCGPSIIKTKKGGWPLSCLVQYEKPAQRYQHERSSKKGT